MSIKMQLLICFFIQGIASVYVWKVILKEKYNIFLTCIISGISAILCGTLNFFLYPNLFLKTILAFALTLSTIFLLFKDSWLKKVICFCLWIILCLCAEFVLHIFFREVFGIAPTITDASGPTLLNATLVGTWLYLLFFLLAKVYFLFKKDTLKIPFASSLTISLIIEQFFLLWACIVLYFSGNTFTSVVLMSITFVFSLMSNYFSFKTTRHLQLKKTIEDQLIHEEKLYETLLEEYFVVQQNEKALSKLRHDIADHLCTMHSLAEQNDSEKLLSYINDLKLK